jgi:hypothetical protein
MYARMTTAQLTPDKVEIFVSAVRDQVIPRARTLQGFRGGYWLADRESGKCIGVTLFADKAALDASAETANRIREEVSRNAGLPIPAFESYEVVESALIEEKLAA